VTLRIEDASTCNPSELFNAPVPESSSVPNDRIAPGSRERLPPDEDVPAPPELPLVVG